jgi:hypothetical protein
LARSATGIIGGEKERRGREWEKKYHRRDIKEDLKIKGNW